MLKCIIRISYRSFKYHSRLYNCFRAFKTHNFTVTCAYICHSRACKNIWHIWLEYLLINSQATIFFSVTILQYYIFQLQFSRIKIFAPGIKLRANPTNSAHSALVTTPSFYKSQVVGNLLAAEGLLLIYLIIRVWGPLARPGASRGL